MKEEEGRSFLQRFVEEFSAPLEENAPLPINPLSRKVSLEELQGESLEMGLKLLTARGAPPVLSALLCQVALSELQQNDLSPFYCPQAAAAANQEQEQEVICLPKKSCYGVQMVQKAASRNLTGSNKYDHISPVLILLHWLLIHVRADFKLLLLSYTAVIGIVPSYLKELVPYEPAKSLCFQEIGLQTNDVVLQSEAVQRVFLNKLINAALLWHQNLPTTPPAPSTFLRCSVHAIKNTRRKMEDKHVALAEFNQLFGIQDELQRAYYAVFDGHGGADAAIYAATHLHVALSKQETLQSDAATALKNAFKHTDDMFKVKAKRERLRSGTTGVAVLIHGQELTVAWLGDSQAILVRKGQVVTLMDPHKPDRQDEKQRIEDLGGCVTFMGCWRVNGTYAVSRAIGDFDQKPYVSGDADCSITHLCGDEDYILLACDGFFDSVKPSEVPHLVLNALRQPNDPNSTENALSEELGDDGGLRVAQHLVGHAKEAGSTDNITVVLVFLRPPEQLLVPLNSTGTAPEMQRSGSQPRPDLTRIPLCQAPV